jgi:hypothetical protein
MKTSLRNVLRRIGVGKTTRAKTAAKTTAKRASAGPATRTGNGAPKAAAKSASGVTRRAAPPSADDHPAAPPTRTGETIVDHRALRFHGLTLNTPDLQKLEHAPEIQGGFKIRVARHAGGRRSAEVLVDRRYATRGYTTTPMRADPRLATFIAYDEGVLVGTVSVRLDSARGLSADDIYRGELDALRRSGARLCEFTRLAVDRTVASKPVLAGLFHVAYLYASVIRGFTHAVIEVNPRHVEFYRKALGFEPIGEERMNKRVKAPAVLLCVPFAVIAEGLQRHAGKHGQSGASRSLFPYGFPPAEEMGVLGRLRERTAGT